jgi:hypothetical protein
VPPRIERVEPVLNVRDVAASTTFYARLGFVEQFRDDPDAPRFVIVSRDDVVLALQWHDFVGIAGDRPNLRFPVDDVDGLSEDFGELPDRSAAATSASDMCTPLSCNALVISDAVKTVLDRPTSLASITDCTSGSPGMATLSRAPVNG